MTAEADVAAVRARYPAFDDLAALVFLALCAAPAGGRALSRKLGRAQSDVFRALSTLEDAGLVAAPPSAGDDPLRRVLALTPAGVLLQQGLSAQTKTPPVRPGGV